MAGFDGWLQVSVKPNSHGTFTCANIRKVSRVYLMWIPSGKAIGGQDLREKNKVDFFYALTSALKYCMYVDNLVLHYLHSEVKGYNEKWR